MKAAEATNEPVSKTTAAKKSGGNNTKERNKQHLKKKEHATGSGKLTFQSTSSVEKNQEPEGVGAAFGSVDRGGKTENLGVANTL